VLRGDSGPTRAKAWDVRVSFGGNGEETHTNGYSVILQNTESWRLKRAVPSSLRKFNGAYELRSSTGEILFNPSLREQAKRPVRPE